MPSQSHPRSHLHPDPVIFISFLDPSISIPHYPQIHIHSIHPKAPLSFTPEPSILPTLCCHLTPIWIIRPDPKLPSIGSPLHHPTHLRSTGPELQYLLLGSSSSTYLNMTAASSCLPRSHRVPAPSAIAYCDRPCLPLGHPAWLLPKSTVPGGFKNLHYKHLFP